MLFLVNYELLNYVKMANILSLIKASAITASDLRCLRRGWVG